MVRLTCRLDMTLDVYHGRNNNNSMKYDQHPRQISCTSLSTLLMVIFTLRKCKLNGKILLHVFPILSGASTVYSVSAR